MLIISNLIQRHARYRPAHTAVVFEKERLTYRQFYERVNRLGNALLAMGLQKGDKIATGRSGRARAQDDGRLLQAPGFNTAGAKA